MRSLSATLEAAQQAASIDALSKIVLTHGGNTYTYTKTRLLDIDPIEEPYRQQAKVLLNNSDGALTDLDLKGYQGVISFGAVTGEGDEYSAAAPLWVINQRLNSSPGILTCELSLIGIMNLLAEDRASEAYKPDEDDDDTVKTIINAIMGATLDCFSHCKVWEVVWDSEDSLIDSFKPKDGFRIYTNGSRLAAFRRLLDYTHCVARPEADGKIHIFQPTITGAVYDYEYYRGVESGHSFFAKAYRKSLVIPNYIIVKSRKDDTDKYEGEAKDQDSIDAIGEIRQYKLARLESDEQAEDVAEAILSKYKLHADMGGAELRTMNVGAEVFDYVKINDDRQNDSRIGNIGYLGRHYKPGRGKAATQWSLNFSFGGWLSIRKLANDLNVYPDGLQQYMEEIFVENLYATYIYAQMIDVEFLSALTANMGQLTAGEIKIGTGTLEPTGTATGGSNTTMEDTGASFTPDEFIGESIRVVISGTAYTRTVSGNTSTIITFAALPGGVVVASGTEYFIGKITVASGDSYFVRGSGSGTATGGSTTSLVDSSKDWEIDEHIDKQLRIIKNGYWYQRKITSNEATTLHFDELPSYEPFNGFRLWTDGELGRIAGFKEGILQFYSGSDGKFYSGGGQVEIDTDGMWAGGGDVLIDDWGISMYGEHIRFYDYLGGNYRGNIQGHASGYLYMMGDPLFKIGGNVQVPDRLRIPVGTDMYGAV